MPGRQLDAIDAVFTDAFEVVLPSTLPPIDPAIVTLKSDADQLATRTRTALSLLEMYEAYRNYSRRSSASSRLGTASSR